MKERKPHHKNNTKNIISILLILVVVVAGLTYYFRDQIFHTEIKTTESTYQTARVTQGNLVISATGTGTLVGGNATDKLIQLFEVHSIRNYCNTQC